MRNFGSFVTIAAAGLAGCSPSAEPANQASGNGVVAAEATVLAPDAAENGATRVAGRASQFTPIDDKSCRKTGEDSETGDWTGSCPGVAGYSLDWSISDLRDDLTVIRGGARSQLSIPTLVANGAFDSLGPKAEWRGPAGSAPDVLIVRVHVANVEGRSDSGSLAIARLNPSPCLVAIVRPGAGQSEKARAIADKTLPACLKS
jgi:hypothetical protein